MTIALVSGQSVSNNGTIATGATVTATFTNTPGVGNLIVAVIQGGGTTAPTATVKDNAGTPNTYTATTNTIAWSGGSQHGVGIYYLIVPAGGAGKSVTVTPTFTGGGTQGWAINIAEFSGTATSSVFDLDAANAAAAGYTSGTITPGAANELIVEGIYTSGSVSGAGSPYTIIGSIQNFNKGAGFVVQSGGPSAQATAWGGTSAGCALIQAAFKPLAAAVITPPFFLDDGSYLSQVQAVGW